MKTFLKLYVHGFIGNCSIASSIHTVLGNLVPEEFRKSKLRISCCNQLFKYIEQLPVNVLTHNLTVNL